MKYKEKEQKMPHEHQQQGVLLFVCFFFVSSCFLFLLLLFFCYVSFIDSEVKLFVRHTLCVFSNCMSSSPISYSLQPVDERIMLLCIFILSRIIFCLNQQLDAVLSQLTGSQHIPKYIYIYIKTGKIQSKYSVLFLSLIRQALTPHLHGQ